MCKEHHAEEKKKNKLHLRDEKKLYLAFTALLKVQSAQKVKIKRTCVKPNCKCMLGLVKS